MCSVVSVYIVLLFLCFFFFKQKTAYEMRISDWSSDVCSSDLCLSTGAHYLDTANYEPRDEAKFEYHWQWAYQDRFKDAGLMALLGSGLDRKSTRLNSSH